jgi:ABC-type dipeptide/oligopeptide/nickel transport system permease component
VLRYIALRLLATVPMLIGTSLVIFTLLRLIPGDAAHAILLSMVDPGADASHVTQADLQSLRRQLGLEEPYPVQYATWVGNVLQGNLGRSFRSRAPVAQELFARLPATLELAGAAMVVMLVVAVPTGILGAVHRGRWPDHVTRLLALLGVSLPSFFWGLILIYVFSFQLGWLPTLGRGSWEHLVLPALALGTGLAATTSRLLRGSLLEVFGQPYLVTPRAYGLPQGRVLWRHALPNALLPVLTSFGLVLGGLIGGAVVVETVFSWPGVGRYVVDAIAGRDYPVVQAFALVMAVVYVLLNLVVDVLYRLVDPRVRVEAPDAG